MLAVTGATGFVGRATCAALGRAGIPFRALGRHPAPGQVGVGEIGPDTDWRVALEGVSVVLHLAARVHHRQDRDPDPLRAYRRTNVEGSLALARQAQAAGVRRFVFVSSIKVNGEHTAPGHPFRAADVPAPDDPYGRSKLEAEQALQAFAATTGLELVIVRPPLVYGADVGANFRALTSLVRRGWPMPFGAIHNRRSLIAVDNLADLLIRCADHPDAAGQTFLCSDGQDISTPELLRAIGGALGIPVRLFPVPVVALKLLGTLTGQRGAIERLTGSLQVDADATRTRIGWRPRLTMQEALAEAAAGWRAASVR